MSRSEPTNEAQRHHPTATHHLPYRLRRPTNTTTTTTITTPASTAPLLENWKGVAGGPLNGSLSEAHDFYLFRHLLICDLRDNRMSGPIPLGLIGEAMPDLKVLNLARNKFTGGLDGAIELLKGLVELVSQGSMGQWSSTWVLPVRPPRAAAGARRLRRARPALRRRPSLARPPLSSARLLLQDISSNKFDCALPSEIGELKELTSLNLFECSLQGEVPKALGRCKLLQNLL